VTNIIEQMYMLLQKIVFLILIGCNPTSNLLLFVHIDKRNGIKILFFLALHQTFNDKYIIHQNWSPRR